MKAQIRLTMDCCALCNPPSLADFEPLCVAFETPHGGISICTMCVGRMVSALTTKEPLEFDLHPEVALCMRAMTHGTVLGPFDFCQKCHDRIPDGAHSPNCPLYGSVATEPTWWQYRRAMAILCACWARLTGAY